MDAHDEMISALRGDEPADAQSLLTDVLATPPSTGIGDKLLEIRQRYIAAGGKLYTLDEINNEVSARRG